MPAGRPRKIQSPEQLQSAFDDYIQHCNKTDRMPNIAGFCVYISIHPDTFYEYAKKDGYSDCIKSINASLEDEVLNNKSQKDLIKLAYLNNKHGYRSDQQQVKFDVDISIDKLEARVNQLLQLRGQQQTAPQAIEDMQDIQPDLHN